MINPEPEKSKSDRNFLTVIPDTNVFIHGKALVDLPWSELDRPIIEIVFVSPVISELDKLKNQTGRPNKVARQLIADVRAMLEVSDGRAEVLKTKTIVTKRVELRPFTTKMHPTLNLDHADQALINYALHLKVEAQDVLLLTDDTICYATAQRAGLPAKLLPADWLRDPEPDEVSKENAKLKEEIKRLKAAEPKIALNFHDDAGQRLEEFNQSITFWPALSDDDINVIMAEIQRQFPQATSFDQETPTAADPFMNSPSFMVAHFNAIMPQSVHEPATEEEIERYKTVAYPNWLEAIRTALGCIHEQLAARTQWPTVRAVLCNTGAQPATDVLIGIRACGNFQMHYTEDGGNDEHDSDQSSQEQKRENVILPSPPPVPRGKVKMVDRFSLLFYPNHDSFGGMVDLPLHPSIITSPKRRLPDRFYWRTGHGDWVSLMELDCTSWRHGSPELSYKLQIRPDHSSDLKGAIELTMQANNVGAPLVTRLPIRISFVKGSTIEKARALVDHLAVAALLEGHI